MKVFTKYVKRQRGMRAVFQKTGEQEVRIVGWDKQSVPTNHYKLYKKPSVDLTSPLLECHTFIASRVFPTQR